MEEKKLVRGVDYGFGSEKYKLAIKKNYGVENVFQSEIIKQKSKETKKEKYGNENYNNIEKQKTTVLEKYGVENISQIDNVKTKKNESCRKRLGVDFPMQSKEVLALTKKNNLKKYGVECTLLTEKAIQSSKQKMIELYGVEHGFQSDKIQKKCLSNLYRAKEYKFPSGKTTWVLGYEDIMLDLLLKEGFNENDIVTNSDCPIIEWVDEKGKSHKHIPDIYIKSLNTIIEVKGEYTYNDEFRPIILLKKKSAELQGFIYKIKIIDKKTKSIKYEIS